MPYVKPDAIVTQLVAAGKNKSALAPRDMLIRGILSGALLGFATTLAITATTQFGKGMVGALVFPVGFVMIVLMGLELVTGNFAVIPMALFDRKAATGKMLQNWGWVFLGNLLGSVLYAGLFYFAVPHDGPVAKQIVATAEAKTIAYEAMGAYGMLSVFVKAILCNWMVTMGVVMAFTSQSTVGKILAMWLPILTFFAQGFEHSVVNMFMMPAGMLFGANVNFGDWWLWNQIPVTLGNIVGGLVFTGAALYVTHRPKAEAEPAVPAAAPAPVGATAAAPSMAITAS